MSFIGQLIAKLEGLVITLGQGKALFFEQGGTTWLRAQRDPVYPTNQILQITVPGSDGNNNKFIYLTASNDVRTSGDNRGAMLELAGNDVAPVGSQGAVGLFAGSTAQGRILLVVPHASGQISINKGTPPSTIFALSPTSGVVDLSQNFIFQPLGGTGPWTLTEKVGVKRAFQVGANARAGSSTLVGGTVTVNNTSVSASTKVFVTRSAVGGTPGFLSYTVNPGVSFTINSSSALDTSSVDWFLKEFVA